MLVTAGLAALIFPITLFGIQGMGRIGVEEVAFILTLYLIHPVSIALILLVCFRKIASGRARRMATGMVTCNALCQLTMAALIGGGIFRGDAWLPLVFGIPSFLFLLNAWIPGFADTNRTGNV